MSQKKSACPILIDNQVAKTRNRCKHLQRCTHRSSLSERGAVMSHVVQRAGPRLGRAFVASARHAERITTSNEEFKRKRRGCLAWLKAALAALPARDDDETIARNLSLIAYLGRPDTAVPMLKEVLLSERLLGEVAARSYRHINHFDKIVLVGNDDPAAYRLTLHLWRPPYSETQVRDELIHGHRFNFWSTILTGTLTSENYLRSVQGQAFREYRYVPELRAQTFRDFYEFAGETHLAASNTSVRRAGESYYLSAPSIHKIVLPRRTMTCSLVLRGPRLRHYSTVFNTAYPAQNAQFDNTMFSPGELAERLGALLHALEQQERPT